jgi:epoxyqueuosine reductase
MSIPVRSSSRNIEKMISKKQIAAYATDELGFDDCRITTPVDDARGREMADWLAAGYHGDMTYLERHLPMKQDPEQLLPGVRSAIIVIKNYKNTTQRELSGRFKIARYAVGKDYHIVMRRRLRRLEAHITELAPEAACYMGVDSRPIDEKGLATRAGVGFQGRNTMVIKPGLGSYFFLGVIFTTLSLEPDSPLRASCGSCRLCLDACPTDALLEAGGMDATRCISYQTIEKKTPVAAERIDTLQDWIFGCDICQEVCPYNNERIPLTNWTEFMPEAGVGFGFFRDHTPGDDIRIPKSTPLHRSRKRVVPNWQEMARRTPSAKPAPS